MDAYLDVGAPLSLLCLISGFTHLTHCQPAPNLHGLHVNGEMDRHDMQRSPPSLGVDVSGDSQARDTLQSCLLHNWQPRINQRERADMYMHTN